MQVVRDVGEGDWVLEEQLGRFNGLVLEEFFK